MCMSILRVYLEHMVYQLDQFRLHSSKLVTDQAELDFSAGKSMYLYNLSCGWWCCAEYHSTTHGMYSQALMIVT